VQESEDEGDLTMPSLGVEQQIDEELADAVAHAGIEQEMGINGNGNGYAGEEDVEEQEPEVPESEHEEADYE
jgi:hypothetical protein